MKINPYYDPHKLSLEMISFHEPGLSWEYNTLCFWATEDGRVYSASDSGCSCPTPFEQYEGEDEKEVITKLERVGSVEQGESIFDSWNNFYEEKNRLSSSEKKGLSNWLAKRLG